MTGSEQGAGADGSDAERAADAFDVLSDPSRVAILRELADRTHATEEVTVEFSELRRAVGFEDAGRFNYHLGKLRDQFVVKRDDGYAPTAVGLKAIGSIEAGTYTDELEPRSGPVDHDCPACGEPLTATYENQVITIECESDGPGETGDGDENGDRGETGDRVYVQTAVPPVAAADADVEDIVAFVIGDLQRDIEAMVDGVCPICSGSLAPTEFERLPSDHLMVRAECENCWMATELPVGVAAVRHPAVVSLYYDHGIDIRDRFVVSDLEFVGSRENAEVVAEDPIVVELTVAVEGDELTLHVDHELNVEAV